MLKRTSYLLLILCFIIIAGCEQSLKTTKLNEPKPTAKATKAIPYSMSGPKMVKEPEGTLVQTYIGEKEFTSESDEYRPAEEKAINAYIKKMKKTDTSRWNAKKWAESIVTNFRTDYSKTIQPLQDFKVEYTKIRLPDGRLLQDVDEKEIAKGPDKVNVALLLDASGSMKANVPGGNKMELAKASLRNFSESLPAEHTNVMLSVFGHKGTSADSDKALSCGSVETVYPLSAYNQAGFNNALNQFNASGWTPLTSAIQSAADQLKKASDENTKNLIYVVSDGIETCGGDPVQAAKDAKNASLNVQINIIGFDVDNAADRQLQEVANAGGGEYTSVKNKQQLDDEITNSWKESMGKTTWRFWLAGNQNNINWDSVGMSTNLQKLYSNHINARNREYFRMMNVLNELLEKDLIDLKTKSEIYDLLYKRNTNIKDYADRIQTEKHGEIFNTAERLRKIIHDVTKDLNL